MCWCFRAIETSVVWLCVCVCVCVRARGENNSPFSTEACVLCCAQKGQQQPCMPDATLQVRICTHMQDAIQVLYAPRLSPALCTS